MKKIIPLFLIITLSVLMLCGCTYRAENYVFGTYYSIKIEGYGSQKIGKSIDSLFIELDNALSTSKADSDLYLINNATENQPIIVSKHTIELFKISKEIYDLSNGAFNPASFPLTELWKFSPSTYVGVANSIPSNEEIDAILPYCGLEQFVLDEQNQTITKLNANAKLDFGAIAKGYAADKAYEVASDSKKSVIDVGRTFKIKDSINLLIASPRGNDYVASATLNNQAVATSGDYERFYMVNDKRYHHIIDKNGYPAGIFQDDPVHSVTIVGESATIADALSTAVFVLGYENSISLLSHYDCSALIITENGYYTVGDTSFEINDHSLEKLN